MAKTVRRPVLRRDADMLRRLRDVEEMARANRRELELQFRRIADIQAELDRLRIPLPAGARAHEND
jgi:hypothetical protein